MAITVVWGEFITHDMAHTPQMTGTKTLVLTSCFTLANRAALQHKCTQAENNGVNFIENASVYWDSGTINDEMDFKKKCCGLLS
jgi:hypothetical protein